MESYAEVLVAREQDAKEFGETANRLQKIAGQYEAGLLTNQEYVELSALIIAERAS